MEDLYKLIENRYINSDERTKAINDIINNILSLSKDKLVYVIGAIDHHVIKYEIDNILEIEYASTCLLIYDLFKNRYNFSEEEKYLIAL